MLNVLYNESNGSIYHSNKLREVAHQPVINNANFYSSQTVSCPFPSDRVSSSIPIASIIEYSSAHGHCPVSTVATVYSSASCG